MTIPRKSLLTNSGISVIIPCFNEEKNVVELIRRFQKVADQVRKPLEILFVDDGSVDSTFQNICKVRSESERLVIKSIKHDRNLGILESWRSGINNAEHTLCLFIDGDLQNRPENLETFLNKYETSYSRVIVGNRIDREKRNYRNFLSKNLAVILRVVFGTKLKDPKSGFIFGERLALQVALSNLSKLKLPLAHTFLGIELERCGFELTEINTDFDLRLNGTSFLKGKTLIVSLKVLFGILIYKFKQVRFSQSNMNEILKGKRLLYFLYFKSMRLHSWNLTGATYDKFKEVILLESLTAEQWREYQRNKLIKLLQYAQKSTDYYRNIVFTGPSSIEETLQSFPLLEKDLLRSNNHYVLMNPNIKFRHRIRTSGSTGAPLEVFADREQLEFRFASTVRALRWTGWEIGRRQIRLWHQKIGMTKFEIIMERIDALLMRRTFIPAFEISESKMDELLNTIRKVRPYMIEGYAESFEYLARYTKHATDIEIPVAISSAQTLTKSSKKEIEEAFNCKVYDKYGAREFSGIAYQCGFGDWYHVVADSYFVEILVDGIRPAKPGEIGEIIITDLRNRIMPLIRYRIGDLAMALDENLKCPCGRNMPLIGPIVGRTTAIVYSPRGVALPGTFFAHFFKEYINLIDHYRVVQEEDFSVKILLKKSQSFSQELFEPMMEQLRIFLQGAILEIEFVESIPLTETGKRTTVISRIQPSKVSKSYITHVLE